MEVAITGIPHDPKDETGMPVVPPSHLHIKIDIITISGYPLW
jgi:hypothetical protein